MATRRVLWGGVPQKKKKNLASEISSKGSLILKINDAREMTAS